ncbi:FkbM family methyltransferase [Blastopirellula sp. J2-11]|uniref:FkbM family methyltransferase n=1 Tax=Blastopirellula sp. J2-11 TaxID=2943192 RepID=UPI0021C6918E|nr:FkbM family methyltransferase [Blastopirellula sp. J2-11]UUO06622.1 FkbM family methyltransferase [Blastopirellula sp. J2-11]
MNKLRNLFSKRTWRRPSHTTVSPSSTSVVVGPSQDLRTTQSTQDVLQQLERWERVEFLQDAANFEMVNETLSALVGIEDHRRSDFDEHKHALAPILEIGSRQNDEQIWFGAAPATILAMSEAAESKSWGNLPHIISFFTDNEPYRSHAARFQKSVEDLEISSYSLIQIPSFQSWHEATAFKAKFIRDKLCELKQNVLWIDVDATLHNCHAHPFFEFADFAIHRHHRWQFASGTAFFAYSIPALTLIDKWIDLCTKEPLNWDQLLLQKAHAACADDVGLITFWLSQDYTKIDNDKWWDQSCRHRPRIVHHQASREVFKTQSKIAPEFDAEFKLSQSLSKVNSKHWPDIASVERHDVVENYHFKAWPGVNFRYEQLLTFVIEYYQQQNSAPFVVEVGAMDGVRFDPLHPWLVKYQLPGLLIEPIPDMFKLLKETYRDCANLIFENVAIDASVGARDMFRISEEAIALYGLESWAAGLSSFYNDRNALGGNQIDEETFQKIIPHIQQESVQTLPLADVLVRNNVQAVDVLQIDTEGHDYRVLATFPFHRFVPSVIHMEFYNLPRAEKMATFALLESNGYAYDIQGKDLCATKLRRPE